MKFKKPLVVVLCIIFMFGVVPFDTFNVSAYTSGIYTYSVSNGKATITDCKTSVSGNITIPSELGGYPVTTIGQYAFSYCKELTNVTVPNGIIQISDYAFLNCENVINISIPNSVTKIGARAFQFCFLLEEIYIPGSVTYIAERAFYDCRYVKKITVDEDNLIYHSKDNCLIETVSKTLIFGCANSIIPTDGSVTTIDICAFFGCRDLKSIYLPDSIKVIDEAAFSYCTGLESINIPDNVTSIKFEAFYSCKSLKEITLPNNVNDIGIGVFRYSGIKSINIPSNVTEIKDNTFLGCTELKVVIIPDSVKSISDSAFDGCYDLTFYGNSGSYAETYAKENNITFKSISNLYQMSASSNQIGADFVIYGNLKTVTGVTASNTNGKLSASKSGYYPINISSHTLSELNRLALVPTSTNSNIAAVHCNGSDILANEITVMDTGENIDLRVYASDVTAKKYQLLTSPKTILNATVIAESTTGQFSLSPSKLPTDSDFYVRVIDSGNKSHNSIKIKLDINSDVDIDFDFGEICDLTIPDSLPVIGGSKIELSLEDMPVSLKSEGDRVYVALGTEYGFADKEFNYKNFKDEVKEITKGLKSLKSLYKKKGFFKKPSKILSKTDVSLMATGYAEFVEKPQGGYEYSAGSLLIGMEASFGHESQYVAWVIPIVIKCKAEVGLEATITLKLDEGNSKLLADGDLSLTLPKLTLSAGVGIKKLADISVYGSVTNKIYTDFSVPYTKASLSGEAGLSAKALFFSGKWAIFDGTLEYYNSLAHSYSLRSSTNSIEELIINEDNYAIDRSYLENQSEWLSLPKLSTFALGEEDYTVSETNILQTSIYDGAVPKTVALDDGTVIMVWAADIAERTNGNHTAAVYSIYSPTLDSWTEPQIIEDDGTADFNPVITEEDGKVYVAWSDSNTVFAAEPQMSEMATTCEIKITEFDFEAYDFKTPITLTDDSDFDGNPSITATSGNVYVSWIGNSENDILTLSGINTVEYAVINSENDISKEVFASLDQPISDKGIGLLDGEVAIAYIVASQDEENNISSTLYTGNIGSDAVALANSSSLQSGIVFTEFGGNSVLFWNDGSNIVSLNSLGGSIETEITDIQNVKFSVISGNEKTAIVYTATNNDETEGTDIYANLYDGAEWSEAVKITENDGYSENVSGYIDVNGNIRTVFTQKIITIEDETLTETVNLCDAYVIPHYDLSISNVEYEAKGLLSGDNMPVTFSVKNNGLYDVSSLNIEIIDSNDNSIYNEIKDFVLVSGSDSEQSIDFILPKEISAGEKYCLIVTPYNESDANLLDNEHDITLGYADISLEVEKVVSENAIGAMLNVTNNSQSDQDIMLYLRADSDTGNVLGVYSLGTVSAGATSQFKFDTQQFRAFDFSEGLVYFEILSEDYENLLEDNVDYITYNCKSINSITGKTVPYYYDLNNDETFDLKDMVRIKKLLVEEADAELMNSYDLNGDLLLNSVDTVDLRKKLIDY